MHYKIGGNTNDSFTHAQIYTNRECWWNLDTHSHAKVHYKSILMTTVHIHTNVYITKEHEIMMVAHKVIHKQIRGNTNDSATHADTQRYSFQNRKY